MKRLLILLGLAMAIMQLMAQARFTSDTELISFGQIEWKHPVTAHYTIANTGDKPLVLTEVEPDCACSVAKWTMEPIQPGEKGEINVTFDAEALGHFAKSVAIFTNAEPHLIYLRFNGEVVREITDFTKTHPYQIGQIRLNVNSMDFPDVSLGEKCSMSIGVVNLSDMPYEPVLMHLPSYLQAESNPKVLQKGERGEIKVVLDSEKLTDLGLTQSSVYLARFSGDKVGEENEIPVSAVLLPDFSAVTSEELARAPEVHLSAQEIDMSAVLAHKSKARQDITMTNRGHSPLQINKLQVFHPAVGVHLKKSLLQPGESTRLRVTVVKKNIGRLRRHLRLLMITNDPKHPKVMLNIKAK